MVKILKQKYVEEYKHLFHYVTTIQGKLRNKIVENTSTKKINQQIKDFGHKLAMHIAALNPLAIEVSQLDKKMLEKEKEIINSFLLFR